MKVFKCVAIKRVSVAFWQVNRPGAESPVDLITIVEQHCDPVDRQLSDQKVFMLKVFMIL
jgi:hypothetical protein